MLLSCEKLVKPKGFPVEIPPGTPLGSVNISKKGVHIPCKYFIYIQLSGCLQIIETVNHCQSMIDAFSLLRKKIPLYHQENVVVLKTLVQNL